MSMPEYQFIHIHTQLILYRLLKCKPANIHQIKLSLYNVHATAVVFAC